MIGVHVKMGHCERSQFLSVGNREADADFQGVQPMAHRIVYLSWPAREISGGIKMAFRHVEVLREAGFDAVIATADAEPPEWFQTTAPVINLNAIVHSEDVLVFPENNGINNGIGGHEPILTFWVRFSRFASCLD